MASFAFLLGNFQLYVSFMRKLMTLLIFF